MPSFHDNIRRPGEDQSSACDFSFNYHASSIYNVPPSFEPFDSLPTLQSIVGSSFYTYPLGIEEPFADYCNLSVGSEDLASFDHTRLDTFASLPPPPDCTRLCIPLTTASAGPRPLEPSQEQTQNTLPSQSSNIFSFGPISPQAPPRPIPRTVPQFTCKIAGCLAHFVERRQLECVTYPSLDRKSP